MNDSIFINGKEFKKTLVSDNYYVSCDGRVYSTYAKRIISCSIITVKGKKYVRVDIHGKHYVVHRLVYEAWVRKLESNEQVNHKNDDGLDNRCCNLYVGTQSENIQDCVDNGHRVGNVFYLTLYDKDRKEIVSFCPASKFIEYSGHPNKSGSLNKFFTKNWFKKRYDIIEFKRIRDLESYKSVTTMADECKSVGQSLSLSEVHRTQQSEEIV